jgi:MipA family protein
VFGSLHYAGFVLSADLRQDVGDGHGGMVGDVGLMYSIPLSSSLIGSFGPKVTWADDKYMQSYFGVSSAQATRSGLPQHDASAGVKSYGVTSSLSYAVSDNWGVTGTIGYAHLADGLANSPVVQDRQQIMSAIFIAYQF